MNPKTITSLKAVAGVALVVLVIVMAVTRPEPPKPPPVQESISVEGTTYTVRRGDSEIQFDMLDVKAVRYISWKGLGAMTIVLAGEDLTFPCSRKVYEQIKQAFETAKEAR